jgi:hypothetical protein
MRLLLIALLCCVAWPSAQARPVEIILIRHAEKPPEEADPHLSARGRERAQAFASFLTTSPRFAVHGLPVALFAARPTAHGHGQRTYETLQPLAAELKLPIETPFAATDYAALAKMILREPRLDGKKVVVCWNHEYLPDMARAFGVKTRPPHWKGDVYDRVWIISFHGKKTLLADLPERLLPGDSVN